MKIIAVGDPHGNVDKLKDIPLQDADLILLTGDLGKADLARKITFENIKRKEKGLKPIKETPSLEKRMIREIYTSSIKVLKYCSRFAPVWFIYGNIEPYGGQRKPRKNKEYPWLPEQAKKINGVRIINNRLVKFKGVKILGIEYFTDTCWVKEFNPKNREKVMKRAKKQTDKIGNVLNKFGEKNLEIFIHHQPPFGYLDKVGPNAPETWRGKRAGSKSVLRFIKKYQPRYSFCGHIHEGQGNAKIGKTEVYNLGVCGYKVVEF